MTDFSKQPSEKYTIAFEYFGRMPFDATLLSATLAGYNVTDSAVDNTILVSTSATIVGTQARAKIQAGVNNKTYKVTCVATLSDGSILEDETTYAVLDT